jgi:hypothetical protein
VASKTVKIVSMVYCSLESSKSGMENKIFFSKNQTLIEITIIAELLFIIF